MSQYPSNKPLFRKELAGECGCSPWYITMMKRAGFTMPARRATVEEFWAWHRERPGFVAKGQPPTPAHRRQQKPTAANM